MLKSNKCKLEYSDETEKEVDEPEPTPTPVAPSITVDKPPSMKKARSDAQKATTARMRVKLEERRRDLVVIKQEAKETALLQQMELKTHIKDKLKAKQLKTKADEKMRQMLLEASDEEEEEESEPESRKKQPIKRTSLPEPKPKSFKQLPSGRQVPYVSQEYPSVRFV